MSVTLVALADPVSAQLPALPSLGGESPNATRAYKQIAVGLNTTFVRIPYLGQASIELTVEDLSRDSTAQPGTPLPAAGAAMDNIEVTILWHGRQPLGWTAATDVIAAQLYGGQTRVGTLIVSNGGALQNHTVSLTVLASVRDAYTGEVFTDEETLTVQLVPFYQGLIRITEYPSGPIEQFAHLTVPVEITNTGLFPDVFLLNASVPEGYLATLPPTVYVPPFESRTVNLSLVAPKGKLYDLGTPGAVYVHARSAYDPRTTYTTVMGVVVMGPYLPSHWIPLSLLALACVGLVVARRVESAELKRLERGRPRFPAPTPRQAVLLAELKRRDPEAFKARKAQLDAVYAERRREYRERRRDERAAERAELKAARAELAEEKAARKEKRKLEKKAAKLAAKRDRALRKEQRKRMRVLEKEKKKLQKRRDKAAAKKAKVDAREAKRLAKVAAKQAKIDAREAKKRAKAEAKAAKAARKESR